MELGSRTALHLSVRGEEKGVACFVYQVWNWSYSYSMNSGFESYKLKIYKFWHLKKSNPRFIKCIKIPLFWNSRMNPNLNPRFFTVSIQDKNIIYISIRERVTTVLFKHRISHLCGALMFILWSQGSRALKCLKCKWAPVVPSCHSPCRAAAVPAGKI